MILPELRELAVSASLTRLEAHHSDSSGTLRRLVTNDLDNFGEAVFTLQYVLVDHCDELLIAQASTIAT